MNKPGDKYQPSNGTEGIYFFEAWCMNCQRDKAMREGCNIDECDDDEKCEIIANTMVFKPSDQQYPNEWTFDENGIPICTAFVKAGDAVPEIDTNTIPLF